MILMNIFNFFYLGTTAWKLGRKSRQNVIGNGRISIFKRAWANGARGTVLDDLFHISKLFNAQVLPIHLMKIFRYIDSLYGGNFASHCRCLYKCKLLCNNKRFLSMVVKSFASRIKHEFIVVANIFIYCIYLAENVNQTQSKPETKPCVNDIGK